MGRIPDETIRKIRDHVDVVELIGRSVTLKRAGRNYKGLCPFHDEKTPSFNVNPDRQSFYCFGCQEGGDAFSFLMKTENLTFSEAARSLAASAGIEVPETGGGDRGLSERLFEANARVRDAYREALAKPGNAGSAYLERRGIDAEACALFDIGWAPDAWDFAVGVLRGAGTPAEVGEQAGLVSQRTSGSGFYDRLRGRVVFPIQDVRGRVVGFGGRAVAADQEPKYLNTPESPLFRKREAFYGFPHALDPIRRAQCAVVVEGYFDRIALHRAGIENAVATCGTALTADHARNLKRRTREAILLFDGDEAGQRAMQKALEVLLPEGLRVRAALLPPGDDPDSLLVREGPEALRSLVEQAPPALDAVIERAVAAGVATPWAKADAVATVAPLLAQVPSSVERSEFERRLALAVGTELRHVAAAVRAEARGEDVRDVMPVAPRQSGPEERNLRQIARCLVEYPALADRVDADELPVLVPEGVVRELVLSLLGAAAAGGVDIEDLAGRLSPKAGALLRSLTVSDEPLEEKVAAQALDDTVAWLRKRHRKQQQRALTEQLRDPRSDAPALLEKKQRLESTKNPVTHSPVGSPT